MQSEATEARKRIAIAAVAGLVLVVAIVAVAAGSGGGNSGRADVAAPNRCVDAWNADQAARAYGRHNFSYHLYQGALVTYLDRQGNEVGAADEGVCAVIFPSRALDPEPFAAGQVLVADEWSPISAMEGMQLPRVAELQAIAAGSPNTTLDAEGALTPL